MGAERFNRLCSVVALLFLLVTVGARLLRGTSDQDFPQYYMGGVIARLGLWDQLYPIPKPGATRNPGFIEDSTLKPRYAEEMRNRVPAGDGVRYMQPPPFALLCTPLSFLPYRQAYILWTLGLTLCAWGVAVHAGMIYRACAHRPTRLSGILVLLIATSPAAHRWVRVMNISPLLGVLIGSAALGLLRNRPVRTALAVWLGGVAKYATGALVPLAVAMRRWSMLIWLVGISLASLLASVAIMGWDPFDEYLRVIAPTLKNTNTLVANQALQGFVARIAHGAHNTQQLETLERTLGAGGSVVPTGAMRIIVIVQVLTLLLIVGLIFSRWRRPSGWRQHPAHVFAGAVALLSWMLIFSPMYWEHYTAYLAPLLGWVTWEAKQSRLRLALALLVGALLWAPWSVVSKHMPEPINSHILWATVLMLILAIDRLARPASVEPTRPGPDEIAAHAAAGEAA
jgi:hypothetical protein